MTPATQPLPAASVSAWDIETDVLVVGFGCAGASAAIGATEAGGSVTIVERTGGSGGASAMAGGLIYMGGGTPIQKACGFEDSTEEMFKFLMAACGPAADEAKVAPYCEDSLAHFDWLVECGVPFKPSFWSDPAWEPPSDDGLMYSGGENAHPFNEIAVPAPRAHIPQLQGKVALSKSGGWKLMEKLTARVAALGVKTVTDTRVERLVIDSDGAVVGAIGRRFGEPLAMRARRGVILSAGGFIYNDEMLQQHAPLLVGNGKVGVDTDDGSGIRMAQAVGAAVKRMDGGEATILTSPALLVRSILVNRYGQRFINEDAYPGRVGQTAFFKQGGDVFLIFEGEVFDAIPADLRGPWLKQPTHVAETIEELAKDLGLPPGSLEHTVAVYNENAARGEDPLCHKASQWLTPLQGPFGAIDQRMLGYRSFTLGGLDTTPRGEVRSVDGEPIPGLFAAGRTTSGIPASGYVSGTSLGDGTFFGRRAGRAAVR